MTLIGTVAQCEPRIAACMTWSGLRTLSVSTFGLVVVVPVDREDLLDEVDPILGRVVEPTDERRDIGRACLGREHRLVGAEAQGHVGANALLLECLHRAEAVGQEGNLHDDVLVQAGELAPFAQDRLVLGDRDVRRG